nr:hypothetical protein [Tanacetum cinerariifolium]
MSRQSASFSGYSVASAIFRRGCGFYDDVVTFPADSFLSPPVTVEVSYGGGDNVDSGGDVGGGKTWSVVGRRRWWDVSGG